MKNIGFFSLSHFLGVIMVNIFLCLIQSLFLPMYVCTPFNTQRHIRTHTSSFPVLQDIHVPINRQNIPSLTGMLCNIHPEKTAGT